MYLYSGPGCYCYYELIDNNYHQLHALKIWIQAVVKLFSIGVWYKFGNKNKYLYTCVFNVY